MYLPLLPVAFESLQKLPAKQLLEEVANKPWEIVKLLEALAQENTWASAHQNFLSSLLSFLLEHFNKGRISSALLAKIASVVHRYPKILHPLFPKDLSIEGKEGLIYQTNSLLFSSVSRIFLSIISSKLQGSSQKNVTIYLEEGSYHALCAIEELAFYGEVKGLWNYLEEQLVDIIRDSHRWEIEKLEESASEVIKKFFDKSTICSYIKLSQENGWEYLKEECVLYTKNLSMGAEIFIPSKGFLGILFFDYRQEAMEFFETLRQIATHIGFTGDIIDDTRFSTILAAASHLKGVDLTMTTIYSRRIFDIPEAIEDLTLDMCSWLTEEKLVQIAKAFPNVMRLSLARNTQLGYRAISAFSSFHALKELSLSKWHQLQDGELKMACQSAPQLTDLSLEGCSSLTDQAFLQVGRYLKDLRSLNVSQTAITDTGLVALFGGAFSLRSLDLEGCLGVSDAGVKEVIRKSSYLQFLNIQHTAVSPAYAAKLQKERPQIFLRYL